MLERQTAVAFMALFVFTQCTFVAVGSVRVEGTAYRKVVVYFESDIPAENRRKVVEAVENLLREASAVLRKAIGFYFSDIAFVLPFSWNLSDFANKVIGVSTNSEKASVADIKVMSTEASSSVFGKDPYTLQHGECGKQGLEITIPTQFLFKEDEFLNKGKLLAREWIKYRYGVFNEDGFPDDPRYPAYYLVPGKHVDDVSVVDCSDFPITYQFRDENGINCTVKMNGRTGIPSNDSNCMVHPVPSANGEVTSSIMSWLLPNVIYPCGTEGHKHDAVSPNKQNTLCNSRSIWDIMKYHSDFKEKQITPVQDPPPTPVFRYLQEKQRRVIMAMDFSSRLAPLKNILNNAAAHLLYSLPSGSEFGFLKFENKSIGVKLLYPLQLLPNAEGRNSAYLDFRIIKFSNTAITCPECAIRVAIQTLAPNNLANSGTIILITANNPSLLDFDLLRSLELSDLCLNVIALPGTTAKAYRQLLEKASCGNIFELNKQASLRTMSQLYEIFDSAIQDGPYKDKQMTLKSAELSVGSPVSFIVDKSFESFTVWLSNTTIEIEVVPDELVLTPSEPFAFQKNKLSVVQGFSAYKIENIKASEWTCELKSMSKGPPVLLTVTAVPKERELLQFQVWAEDTTVISPSSFAYSNNVTEGSLAESSEAEDVVEQMPFKLYAKVFQENNPIINAKVMVEITPPSGSRKISFPLLDNGIGDPDTTRNDGIYSRYFTQFSGSGKYEVVTRIDDNSGKAGIAKAGEKGSYRCCGSEIMYKEEIPTGQFLREEKYWFYSRYTKPKNGYRPSSIRDLTVVNMQKPFIFILQWTSPGNEKDHGQTSAYFAKLFSNHNYALNALTFENMAVRNIEVERPAIYGTSQNVTVNIEKLDVNTSYYFVMWTMNTNGKLSDMSNIVEIYLSSIVDPVTPIPDGSTPDGTGVGSAGTMSETTIGIIVGCTLFIVILLIAAYVVFYFFYVKPKKTQEETEQTEIKEVENNVPKRHDGSVRADEWQPGKSTIHSANSIPASVLLQHHKQVEDAKKHNRIPPLFKLENLMEETPNTEQFNVNNLSDTYSEIERNIVPNINILPNNPHDHNPQRKVTNV